MADKIRTLGPGTLTIGETATLKDFSADVTKVTVTPDTSTDDEINFLDGSTDSGAQTISWELSGSIKEDYSMGGLQAWCLENAGKTMPFTFKPNDDAKFSVKGKCTIAPVAFGGDVKSKNDVDFKFAALDVTAAAA